MNTFDDPEFLRLFLAEEASIREELAKLPPEIHASASLKWPSDERVAEPSFADVPKLMY